MTRRVHRLMACPVRISRLITAAVPLRQARNSVGWEPMPMGRCVRRGWMALNQRATHRVPGHLSDRSDGRGGNARPDSGMRAVIQARGPRERFGRHRSVALDCLFRDQEPGGHAHTQGASDEGFRVCTGTTHGVAPSPRRAAGPLPGGSRQRARRARSNSCRPLRSPRHQVAVGSAGFTAVRSAPSAATQ